MSAAIREDWEVRKKFGPERSIADTDVWFGEKLVAFVDAARMLVDAAHRQEMSIEQAHANLIAYGHILDKKLLRPEV